MAAGPFSAGVLMCLGSAGRRLPALAVQSLANCAVANV